MQYLQGLSVYKMPRIDKSIETEKLITTDQWLPEEGETGKLGSYRISSGSGKESACKCRGRKKCGFDPLLG